jgi:hypothetical protein
LCGSVRKLLHHEHGDVLLLILVQGRTQNDVVNIPIDKIRNRNIINEVVTIQVQIIDHLFLTVQRLLKFLQGLRFLEKVHDGIEVKVVSRQTQVFIGIILGSQTCCRCGKHDEGKYGM